MSEVRKDLLVEGKIYHVFNKSIAEFKIFNNESEFSRMVDTVRYYQRKKPTTKFSKFIKSPKMDEDSFNETVAIKDDNEKLVEIIAYCIMPTHLHLILKQLQEEGISIFMSNIQNSYARYFNIKLDRKGPLWVGRFKNVLVKTDEQLLHLTRYIHLNPVTANLVHKAEKWLASSYQEYILKSDRNHRLCKYDDILDIESVSYRKFVEDRAAYQRDLEKIKNLIFE